MKQSAVQSPNILSMGERTPADLPRTMVWLGDRMHFKVTEFKCAMPACCAAEIASTTPPALPPWCLQVCPAQ